MLAALRSSRVVFARGAVRGDRAAVRGVWSTGIDPGDQPVTHPTQPLTPDETARATRAIRGSLRDADDLRFVAVSLREPTRRRRRGGDDDDVVDRAAEAVVLRPSTGIASEITVSLSNDDDGGDVVTDRRDLPAGTQPMLTPDDCELAERVMKSSDLVRRALRERYGVEDVDAEVAGDPWSVHLADDDDRAMTRSDDDDDAPPRRLVQTFLYHRRTTDESSSGGRLEDCNHYAHPIDIVPVVDLNAREVVRIDGLERTPPPAIPAASVNYHRNLLATNSYLATRWRDDRLRALRVSQPEGPSFRVEDGNRVEWQNWSFRVGFNYREGLVLHDVAFDGRDVLRRASLVEMAVPYADPNPPFQRKCAFDVGDYGLGYCANSLELGCDCLGLIHYFDVCLADAAGDPYVKKKAICMHEEDDGVLWKHVEYRNGHNESRRSRELVVSFIATVVNYEYLFYWRFKLDGTIDYEIRLSGELSTNLPSVGEDPGNPGHGVIVAPGVNSQIHQHMFCARLDAAVDGLRNTVDEVDVVPAPRSDVDNPYGNAFFAKSTVLTDEAGAVRLHDATKARAWKIRNAEGRTNPVNGNPTAYKLLPFTRGPAQPPLLTADDSAVSSKGAFARAHLWVTPYAPDERYPAGEYTVQQPRPTNDAELDDVGGLSAWTRANRNVEAEDVVLWHAFGVTHVPRVEDFPVMPCESTGFTLKPDGFSAGNPAIDLFPETDEGSRLSSSPSSSCCGDDDDEGDVVIRQSDTLFISADEATDLQTKRSHSR